MIRESFLRDVPKLGDQRVTVMGLGLFGGGVAVSRALARRGARVTVTDLKPEAELRESVEALNGTGVEFHLGGHRDEDFRNVDLVIVNPAVPLDSPYLDQGVPLESEMNLFFKLCRSKQIIGVTGSNGKTTTTTLIGEILQRGPGKVWVGGNIGTSLIEHVDAIGPKDTVVLELSSFQLEHLGMIERSPNISVLLNITPNHLDRHRTMENYIEAKRQIVAHQKKKDLRILNSNDPVVRKFAGEQGRETCWFSTGATDNEIEITQGGVAKQYQLRERKLPGRFNLENMAASAATCLAVRQDIWKTCEEVFATFPGVEHRLEFVGEVNGVNIYNDSIATNPESTIAALETLPGPIVLLAGGYDKKLPFAGLAAAMKDRVRILVLTGQTADAIEESVRATRNPPEIARAASFDETVRLAREAARPGDTLLLSPACASFGEFRNFAERGRRFKELVRK